MNLLDFKTKLYLCITGVVIEKEKKYTIKKTNTNVAYIFNDYSEFKAYFEKYLDKVDEDIIDLAIYTRGKKGQIIALKGLCDHIITNSRFSNIYLNLTKGQIEDIHTRGKITPLEKVQEWESFDLCAPGNYASIAKSRCKEFCYNCHECLLEYASHKLEYDKMDFKVINPYNEKEKFEKNLVLKK